MRLFLKKYVSAQKIMVRITVKGAINDMKKLLVLTLCVLSMLSYMLAYAEGVTGDLSRELVRFHIIANSDSEYDQAIKLDVRDYICKNIGGYSSLAAYSDEILHLANERLAQLEAPYRACVRAERVFIPQKSYKNITLPSGRYRAVRLLLGKGGGKNWWCVAYPPLCFSESPDGEMSKNAELLLRGRLSPDGAGIIFGDAEYRLWTVDFAEKLLDKIT